MWIYRICKKENLDPLTLWTPLLTRESNIDSSEPSTPFQETLNDVKEHGNRIELEMTMELNNMRDFFTQTSYINSDVSKSKPGTQSMKENIVPLEKP